MEPEQKANDQVNSLLMVNGLDYRMPPTLSVAVSRGHSSYASNQQVYPSGSILNVTMSSGAQYINFRESYLKFKVSLRNIVGPGINYRFSSSWIENATPNLPHVAGKNGVLNCFETFRWIHSSGTLLDEMTQDFGLWSYVRDRYTMSSDQVRSTGSLSDFGQIKLDSPAFTSVNNTHTFLVPLSCLSDCFNKQQLCPSFLAAGSRIELRVSDVLKTFTEDLLPGANPTESQAAYRMEITDCELVLQQVQLTDAIVRALSNISASSGLEYPFTSVAVNSSTSSNLIGSIQVSRSLSRANGVIVVRREANQLSGTTAATRQSNCPGHFPISKYSCLLGGQTIPLTPVRTQQEAMWHALVTFGSAHDPSIAPPVAYSDFNYLTSRNSTAELSDAIYCVSLETSSTLNQSGSALSSQRILVFNYEAPVGAAPSTYTMFTPHVRLATVFLDSVIVRS